MLCGIEKLLEKIAQLCINKNVLNDELLNKIKTIYPANRLPNKIETFKTISLFGPDESQPFDEWCKTPVYDQAKYDAIISCAKLKKEIKENKDLQLFLEQSEKYEELFPLLTDGISEKHKKMIRTILDKLIEDQKKGKKFFGSLLDIYARIGYEVGRIKKRLQEAHINWGSYIDRGFDYHCNAHSNNLVILPQGNDSLLAPLDFDLAFSKEKMIMIYKEAQTFGQHDETYWDNYINAEFVDLSLNLCGYEDFNFAFEKNKKNQDSLEIRIRNTIKYLLCDCMLENYMKGFDNIPSEDVIDNNKLKEDSFLHNIVKLALISTADDVA